MVGVPRSKGCRICVQRRVKCDQTKPTCNNCKKGNRPCPGYGTDLKFQDEGVRLRRRFGDQDTWSTTNNERVIDSTQNQGNGNEVSITNPPPATSRNPDPLRQEEHWDLSQGNHWDVVGLDMNTTDRRTFLGLLEGKTEAYAALADTMPETQSSKFRTNIDAVLGAGDAKRFMFMNFDIAKGPAQHLNDPEANQKAMVHNLHHSLYPDNQNMPKHAQNHARWLEHLPPLTGTNPLLDAAVRAVTLVHIGRLNGSEAFVMESRPYYGQALSLLNKTLQSKKAGMSNETLCAVILLSFYEMFASDNNEAWVRHAGGVSALMRARGPAKHRTGLDREIFLAYRFTLIIESFQQDVPCFLAEPGWVKLSQDIHEDVKRVGIAPNRVEIFDVSEEYYIAMVGLPKLCAEARSIWQQRQKGLPCTVDRAQLIDRMMSARVKFRNTFERFETALKKAGHAPTINLTHRDPLIGIEYWFVNTFVSSTYIGYWTVSIVLNMCLMGLHRDDQEMCRLYQTESKECTLNICRTSAFMLTSSFLGPFFLIFGLRVGLLVFEEATPDGGICPEADWILRKLFEIGDKHMGIARHIPGFESGMTVEELIQKFRTKNAEMKQPGKTEENQDFQDHITRGQPNETNRLYNSAAFNTGPNNDESGTSPSHRPGNVWQGINQLNDVAQAWDDQANFELRSNIGNLDLMSSSSTSSSSARSPQPQVFTSGQQKHTNITRAFMPDMSFADPLYGMDDVDMQSNVDEMFQSQQSVQQQSPAAFYSSEGQPTAREMQEAMAGLGRSPHDSATHNTSDQQQSSDKHKALPRGLERFFS